MEARNPTNLAPNVRVPTNKHLTDYQLNNGPPSAGQTVRGRKSLQLVQ